MSRVLEHADQLRRHLERARTAVRWDNRLWMQRVLDDMQRELTLLERAARVEDETGAPAVRAASPAREEML